MRTQIKGLLGIGLLCFGLLQAAPVSPAFVHAINMVETGGATWFKYGQGDNGLACGPLQIHQVCWEDAIQFNKSIGGNYYDCTGLVYATVVMNAYLNRYCPAAVKSNDYQTMARIWNGGPHGKANPKTLKYWLKVKQYLPK